MLQVNSWLTECKHLLLNQLGLFFKIGYVCTIPKGVEVGQDLTQLEVKILCDYSTGRDEVDDYFATEADRLWSTTMIDIEHVCENDLNKALFWIFTFNRNIYQIVLFNC